MKNSLYRIIAVILSVFILASLCACRDLPSPKRTQSAASSHESSQDAGSSLSPGQPSDGSGGTGGEDGLGDGDGSGGAGGAGSVDGSGGAGGVDGSGGAGDSDTVGAPGASGGAEGQESPEAAYTLPSVAMRRIFVDLSAKEVMQGTYIEPKVVIHPADATDKTYTISSSDENVLRETNGRWIAVGGGTADLIVMTPNGVSGRATVTVTLPVESISLGSERITMARGDRAKLALTVLPEGATGAQAIYTSDNEGVATVTKDGTIHAVGVGTASILCTVGDAEATCAVTVAVPVTGITISTDKRLYKTGDNGSITVSIAPDDATDKRFTVTIDGTAASLTGESAFSCSAGGEVTITVTAANGVKERIAITIVDLAALADEVFRLTNIERGKAGLPPFSSRASLTKAAAVRAEEIIRNFSHDRPNGSSCFTAFAENGVDYSMAGENIAMGQRSPDDAVRDWMNSPGHRAAILETRYGHLGVGVAMDADGRLYWTQAFTD